ncbi:hypothetical protein E4P24_02090 [Haloferax sp. AS1]|uniref:hypothetical protein n=1 Tax=Haloferax sp. AS1 TaxID=2562277 RepID=UPI00165F878C|nr:hypothetical protein [Haloferax sp. AS1]MBC9985163.1 hypothetical protein [Haloferax sp. AS1]
MGRIGDWFLNKVPNDRRLREYSLSIVFFFVLVIVLLDLLIPERIDVHWQMVALIGILALVPFVPLIESINVKDMGITFRKRVKNTKYNVEKAFDFPEDADITDYLSESMFNQYVYQSRISPLDSLPVLRNEIERILRKIVGDYFTQDDVSFDDLIVALRKETLFPRDGIRALQEVNKLTKIAIQEQDELSEREISRVRELGITTLARLNYYYEQTHSNDN